jgi:hypothetical protein
MADPLVDIKEHEVFLEDKASVENALAHASRFATDEPFKSRQEAGEAADAIAALKNIRIDAEKRKLDITAQWRVSTNAVNTQYKELLSPVGAAEQALKQKGLAFQQAEQARAAEEQRQREAEQAKAAEAAAQEAQEAAEIAAEDDSPEMQELASEARKDAAAAAVAPPPAAPAPPRQVRGGFASLGSRTVYKFELVDADAVPAAYKVVDSAAIKAVVTAEASAAKAEDRAFALEIPGVRIFSEEIAVSR